VFSEEGPVALTAINAIQTVNKVGVGANDVRANGRKVEEGDARFGQQCEVRV
jgi:hypothetical protein